MHIITGAPCCSRTEQDGDYEPWIASKHVCSGCHFSKQNVKFHDSSLIKEEEECLVLLLPAKFPRRPKTNAIVSGSIA
jgi:hypothetical protein